MRRYALLVLGFSLLGISRISAAQDALDAPVCVTARAQLERATANASPGSAASMVSLAKARAAAAAACLHAADAPRHRTEPLTRPYAVEPVVPGPGTALSGIVPPAPVVTLPSPPAALTLCDPGGCWDSNGRRLNRLDPSPVLQGPAGACIPVGGTVRCP